MLVGNLATQRVAINRAGQICDFDIRMDQLNSKVSDLDRRFIAASIAANTLEIQSLNYALGQAQNEEWRGLIQMMIAQHTADLNMAMKIAKKINVSTNVDLTNVRVYPGTPEYDLGIRRVDLTAKFLDPLMSAGGTAITPTVSPGATDTPTAVPTTGMTDTPTAIGTMMDTATPADTPTVDLTGTATGLPTDTATGVVPTDTDTPTATSTVDLTGTATAGATDTAMPSDTPTVDLTGTASAVPSAVDTSTPTLVPTLVPTLPGGPTANFDLVSLIIIENEHAMMIETALAAERLVQNDEIRAFAKHAADMAQLHMIFLTDLQYRLLGLMVLPPPSQFQKDYQGPRRFGPDGND